MASNFPLGEIGHGRCLNGARNDAPWKPVQRENVNASMIRATGRGAAMRTILIVEDEYFIADDCAALARQAGYHVVGPFASIDEARPHAARAGGAELQPA
ncbi:hypothetical protein [Bradyrhizobium elkanii]|uniref:hypothetical protein n=2 Tax=Nitrobacteraceae TaxID=41294 RepID=UPI001FCB2BC6|nr:hypothetical protein [Bradyrhizobium elkanii]WLA78880.1 hypothetical protein QNJ99_26025 [Bradyrhizobium elkanii]